MNDPRNGNRLLFTVEEAGAMLSISRAHCYRLITSGQLNSVKIGRSRRVSVQALCDFADRLDQSERLSRDTDRDPSQMARVRQP